MWPLPLDRWINTCWATATEYTCTKFGVKSSSGFPVRACTNRQTDATEHARSHASGYAVVGNQTYTIGILKKSRQSRIADFTLMQCAIQRCGNTNRRIETETYIQTLHTNMLITILCTLVWRWSTKQTEKFNQDKTARKSEYQGSTL